MKSFTNILVAIDTRFNDLSSVNTAASMAKLNGSRLTIVDTVPEFTWASRFVVPYIEDVRGSVIKVAKDKLEVIAETVREQGIEVETRVLEGSTSVSVTREVISGEYDLLVARSKGRNSRSRGYFGQTAKQLLRNCPCPLWLIPPDAQINFEHILACVDTYSENPLDIELNEKIYSLALKISDQQGSRLSLLHAWIMEDEAILSARLKPETVEAFADQQMEYRKGLLYKFLDQFSEKIPGDDIHLVKDSPSEAVSRFVREGEVDLVVMGTVARSGIFGLLIGNTAEKILEHVECSVIAVKPESFKSPVK